MKMKLIVRSNSKYKEVRCLDGNSEIQTGLLDEEESISLAKDLINAVEDLIPHKFSTEIKILEAVREGL